MSVTKPRWRGIDEFPHYEVSEEGEVRCWLWRRERLLEPRRITPHLHTTDRWIVKIRNKTRSIAVLVLLAFRGPHDNETQFGDAEFLDGDANNCHVNNLRWKPRASTRPLLP